jgi:serine protein kinase
MPSDRLLRAIGEPTSVDTRTDPRLSRIFMNRKVNIYEPFKDFYGMEETVEKIVSFLKHASQDLEESKQILYLLGPVGGGKSSLVERLKTLFASQPFYTIKAKGQVSPHYESPFGLFPVEDAAAFEAEYGIPRRVFKPIMSPWAAKRLGEFNGDLSQFTVVKMYPDIINRIAIAKAEPGDENNQDTSVLIGKVDIRKLEDFGQDDPDAYSYSGALNVTSQGFFDYVEMFKASIKMLNPLLTATQDHNYNGVEGFGAMPFHGILVAHSNEAEWEVFRNNKRNEAFIDRMYTVKVPYCLRVSDEVKIYNKLIAGSTLNKAKIAPGTMEMLAEFSILGRLKVHENSDLYTKLQVYDGRDVKSKTPDARSLQEYKDEAGVNEGMEGPSTRFGFKVISKTINFNPEEIAANPVHLMYVLENQIKDENYPRELEDELIAYIKGVLAPKYATFLADEIQQAYLESYSEYGQNLFDRYVTYADAWIQKSDFRDPDTGEMYDLETLNSELEKTEKPAGIGNPRDFRHEVVNFVLREKANNGGIVKWTSYEKLRSVIEKKMFANTEDLMPIISFNKKSSSDEQRKHDNFVDRMTEKGYTEKQVKLLVDWFMRFRRHG